MLRRLDGAAAKVCADQAPCERRAVEIAVARLASPQLAALRASDDAAPAPTRE
jgi:hypothetical protein